MPAMSGNRFWHAITLTGTIYGFAGWVYIVINSEVHQSTLHLPLTHFTSWPHEDTFGAICFLVSLTCFFFYTLLRSKAQRLSDQALEYSSRPLQLHRPCVFPGY